MSKKKPPTTSDEIDIKSLIEGPIKTVIANLQELAAKYPDGDIDVSNEYSYGESYAAVRLRFMRIKEPVEIERDEIDGKTRLLHALRTEAAAFANNGAAYPRDAEIKALAKELGFLAMAPMHGVLQIYDGEVLVMDISRGARRRDGSWVYRTLMDFGDDKRMKKLYEAEDAPYREALDS